MLLPDQLVEGLRPVAPGDDDVGSARRAATFRRVRRVADAPRCRLEPRWQVRNLPHTRLAPPGGADERPTAPGAYCLWLLTFAPDQVHRSPLRGPLIGRRLAAYHPILTPITGLSKGGGNRSVGQRVAAASEPRQRSPKRRP